MPCQQIRAQAVSGATRVTRTSLVSVPAAAGPVFLGDSTVCGEGASNFVGANGSADVDSNGVPNNGYAYLTAAEFPRTQPQLLCQGAATLADSITRYMLLQAAPPTPSSTFRFVEGGLNDAGQHGGDGGAITQFSYQMVPLIAWLSTTAANIHMGSGCTYTPGTGNTRTISQLGQVTGIEIFPGDDVKCTLDTANTSVAVVYRSIDGQSGAIAALFVDGVQQHYLTGSGYPYIPVDSSDGATQSEFGNVYPVVAGTHTIEFIGIANLPFILDYVATPQRSSADAVAPLVWVGAPWFTGYEPAAGALYTTAQQTVASMAALGWPVTFADTRAVMNSTTDVAAGPNTSPLTGIYDPIGSTYPPHPNDNGHRAVHTAIDLALARYRTVPATKISQTAACPRPTLCAVPLGSR